LAADIGITRCYIVGNKVRDHADRDYIRSSLPNLPVIGFLSVHPRAVEADIRGEAIFDAVPELVEEARQITAAFDNAMTA
jgi:CO dehydrogenase nickel-insertion accessory protein CooC1